MSIVSPPKRPTNVSASGKLPASSGGRIGSDQLIESRIDEACKALWQAEVIRTVLRLAVGCILLLLAWVVVDQWIYSPGPIVRSLAFLSLAALLVVYFARHVRPLFGSWVRPEYAARSLEKDLPELRQSLTSYVTLRDDRESGNLRSRVVRSIGAETASRLRRHDALPAEATGTMRWWIAAIAGLAILVAYAFLSPKNSLQSAARLAAPLANIDPPRRVAIRNVQPGNSEAIAGRAVEISAEIEGLRSGEQAICRWQLPSGWQELELVHDPAVRSHNGQLQLPHSASGAVSYSIQAGDATAGPFQLTVQDVPVVALESVHYRPPQYTGLAPYTSSTGAITAVDGTTVEILASTNRAVSKAKIEFNPRQLGGRVQATAGATEMQIDAAGTSLSVAFPLRSAQGRSAAVELEDYRILVEDAAGQGNPDPIVYPIRVVPDLAPEVSITVPASTPKSVPLDAQQTIEVHASDPDFGLKQISLEIRAGIDRIREPVLWTSPAGEKGHQVAEFGLRPSELQLRAGDTVQVVAIAVDNRSSELYSDVEPNVVRTDPVTLKITASGEVPERNDPNADGLSSPDTNQGDNGQSGSQPEEGDSGQQGSGGGGSGESSKSESGEGQGGTGGQGETGDSTQDSSSESGGEGNEGQSTDPGQQGGQDGGAQGSQDSGTESSRDSGTGDSAGNNGEPSESESVAESEDGNANQTEQPGQQGEGAGSQPQTGETGGQQDNRNRQDQAGNQPGAQNGEANRQQGSTGGDGSPQGSQSGDSQPGTSSGSGGQQAGQPKQAPEHDGEAFERIQEFLEQQQRDSQTSNGSSGASERTDGDRADAGQQNTQNGEGESRDPTEQGTSGPQQDQGNGSDETRSQKDGSSTGQGSQQSSGPDGSSQETPADQQTPSGDSGQQASDTGRQGEGSGQDASSSEDQSSTGTDRGRDPNDDAQTSQGGSADDSGEGDQGVNGDQAEGTQNDSDQRESTGSSGEPRPGQNGDQSQSPGSDSESQGQPGRPGSTQAGSPQTDGNGESNTTAQASSGGAGDGGEVGEASQEPAPPPDPVNLDYAKEATDLVLDYLEQTRDNPDPKLLEELKWNQEDLKRFADRWKQIRELPGQPGGSGRQEMEEALKSLGLRPKTGEAKTTREAGDALRGIRDAGNRQPPPAAFRDAFDAFRRAVGQQQTAGPKP